MVNKTESRIQSEILLAVSKEGHRLFRANAGRIKDERTGSWIKLFPKGFPDTCGWHKDTGQFIAIEVKNEKGKLSEHQIKFKEFAQTQPILYGVARSAEDALKIINGCEVND